MVRRLGPLGFGVALALSLAGCTLVSYTPKELVLSQRYGLVALEAVELARITQDGLEVVEFRFLASPYAPSDLYDLGEKLKAQLKARGFEERCQTYHLPLFGGGQYTLRMARGGEGVGLFLKPLAQPQAYRLEVGPASPNPPLDCPAR